MGQLHCWSENWGYRAAHREADLNYDSAAALRELLELRTKLAAGPVMPEVPSDLVLSAISVEKERGAGRPINFYDAIRSALPKKEQPRPRLVPVYDQADDALYLSKRTPERPE